MKDLLEQLESDPHPIVGYHISPAKNRNNIEMQGLVPDPMYRPGEGHVWFFASMKDARSMQSKFARGFGGGNDIWEINLRGLHIEPDPHDAKGYKKIGLSSWAYKGIIPPDRLRRVLS